jgi:O-antigen/teichoic acid export membrane protein
MLPQGFWIFSFTTTMTATFAFFYGSIDRIAILSIHDLAELGMYQAVISINAVVERVSTVLLPSILPTFSNLLGVKQHNDFHSAFAKLCRFVVLPATILSLITMAFSYELLSLFGNEYTQYRDLLTIFGLVSIIRSLNIPSRTILTCKEKNSFRFWQSFIMIMGQGGLTYLLMVPYGLSAIVGAKLFCVTVASICGGVYVFFVLDMAEGYPLSYKAAVLTGLLTTVLRIFIIPVGWLYSFALLLFSIVFLLAVSRFKAHEVSAVIGFVIERDEKKLTENC